MVEAERQSALQASKVTELEAASKEARSRTEQVGLIMVLHLLHVLVLNTWSGLLVLPSTSLASGFYFCHLFSCITRTAPRYRLPHSLSQEEGLEDSLTLRLEEHKALVLSYTKGQKTATDVQLRSA